MDLKKIINWGAISVLLTGNTRVIRANRDIKKYSKEIESLKKYLGEWAKENNIEIK